MEDIRRYREIPSGSASRFPSFRSERQCDPARTGIGIHHLDHLSHHPLVADLIALFRYADDVQGDR